MAIITTPEWARATVTGISAGADNVYVDLEYSIPGVKRAWVTAKTSKSLIPGNDLYRLLVACGVDTSVLMHTWNIEPNWVVNKHVEIRVSTNPQGSPCVAGYRTGV